jgi:hypothetical protein
MKIFGCVTLMLLAGCGAAANDDVCVRAAAHLAACGESATANATATAKATATGECDSDAAAAVLALDCAALADANRRAIASVAQNAAPASLSGIACAAGIVRFCPVPACDAPPYPTPSATCSDYIDIAGCGGCQFYACREAEHACGTSGYYLGYAEKYCVRFLQALRPRMSPDGQRFLDVARDCLMRYVDDNLPPADACDDVAARAFQSHVACYHDNGFCQLSLHDQWLLVNTVDPADFNLSAALQTAFSCL